MSFPVKTKDSRSAWFFWSLGALFFFTHYIVRVSISVITADLMHEFTITALELGKLSGFFYVGYLFMQLPAGFFLDRFGPRLLLALSAILCGCSALMLSLSGNITEVYFARLFFGLVAAFAFVGSIKLARAWFSPKHLGLVIGLTQGMGMLGAATGNGPLSHLVSNIGWRPSLQLVAMALLTLGALIAIFVRNHPTNVDPKADDIIDHTPKPKLWNYIAQVLWCRYTWFNALYAGLIYAPVEVFGELWGVSFLVGVHQISHAEAARAGSLIFLGWFCGGPLFGWLADQIGRRPTMIISAIAGLIIVPTLIYATGLSALHIAIIMFIFGLSNAGLIAAYTVAGEMHPEHSTGLSVGITNMISVIIGACLQPVIGLLINFYWDGQYLNGIPAYSAEAFQSAMRILPLCPLLALICAICLKETLKKD